MHFYVKVLDSYTPFFNLISVTRFLIFVPLLRQFAFSKKGWHTGSLRNIENVWKVEQKHEAEQKKLEELRKLIHEERRRTEFHLLQEKDGLVPHQERLEFLYDSGLSVGKSSSSDGFKSLEQFPKLDATDAPSSSTSASKEGASVPGALFEDKPQSAKVEIDG